MSKDLLLGCGFARDKRIRVNSDEWGELTTLDNNPKVGADIIHDLVDLPYPFEDNTFDEIHAYEVMEHVGQQGDWKFFFDQMFEIWRILKPNGFFCCTAPTEKSIWLWADPGHTRTFLPQMMTFLNLEAYNQQMGVTSMTNYLPYWKGDFVARFLSEHPNDAGTSLMVLEAIKPVRNF